MYSGRISIVEIVYAKISSYSFFGSLGGSVSVSADSVRLYSKGIYARRRIGYICDRDLVA
jgi:hypothetical protein